MTNALANFTQQGSKVSVVSGTLVGGLNRTSGAMDKAKKSSTSLAAAFGKFYATYFLLIRGTKKLWSSIESSFDYLEVLNYFDAAFGQAAANADLQLDALPDALDLLKGDVALKATELTDTIQTDLIGSLDKVIEDARIGWEEKGGFGRWINGVFGGADTEAAYVQEAVNKQVENIDKVSTTINEQLGNLQTDGVVWASDAVREIYKALFTFGDNEAVDRGLNGLAALTLNEDFKSLINGATEGISELAKERGKDATDGYASGFSDEENI